MFVATVTSQVGCEIVDGCWVLDEASHGMEVEMINALVTNLVRHFRWCKCDIDTWME
jgi:hypothetical protein